MKFFLSSLFFSISLLTQAQSINDSIAINHDSSCVASAKNHRTLKTIAIGAGYSGLCFLSYKYADKNMQKFTQANQNKTVNFSLQTVGYLGLTNSNIAIIGCTGIAALITKNPRLQKATILLTAGQMLNGLVTKEIKYTFQRHRPNTGDPYNTFDWRGGPRTNTSFVSGHSSDIFTTATIFAICFNNKKWVPVVAYSTATLVGLSRIYQNQHWTSDVMVGAGIGFLSAQAVNKLYNMASRRFLFLPAIDNGHVEASLVYNLR